MATRHNMARKQHRTFLAYPTAALFNFSIESREES